MNFDNFEWHDAVIKNIVIDRAKPGINDTIIFDILWYDNSFSKLIFTDVYFANLNLNFGIVADECIDCAYVINDIDTDLERILINWKGFFPNDLNCFIIKTISTASTIKIIAKNFVVK